MIRFARYRPAFFTGFEEPDDNMEFVDTKALMESKHGQRWLSDPDLIGVYVILPEKWEKRETIIIDVKHPSKPGARQWWVMGFCTGDHVQLPEWRKPTSEEYP